MPWKVESVSLQRQSLCYRILHQGLSVASAAREAGVSRKTLYKFLSRYKADPALPLRDHSRRPLRSPGRVSDELERRVLELRDQYRWGARKLHALLRRADCPGLCSVRTLTAILRRHDRIGGRHKPEVDESICQSFERPVPNDLWQLDHKGPIEIERVKHHPLTVVDDHSRFCLCFEPLKEKSLAFAWPLLWDCFGEYGLPEAILSDGAFADRGTGISLFDQRLLRLGIRPIHGRPYHPQTQGKVERLHGTLVWELMAAGARTDSMAHFLIDRDRWQSTYNLLRPHEALGDSPPITRYTPSRRRRPQEIPPMGYEPETLLRRVSQVGDVRYHRARVAVGRGLARQQVKLVETQTHLEVYFGPQVVRVIALDQLAGRRLNQIV